MLRKVTLYTFLLFFCLQFMFCRLDESETDNDQVLTVTPTEMHFSMHEGEKPFMVQTKYKMAWLIDSTFSAEWVHVKEDAQHKLFVVVDENLSGTDRTSIIEVATVDKKHKKVISISQLTTEAKMLEVSADTITLYTNIQAYRLTISADGEWHLDSIADWISLQKIDSADHKIVFDVISNSVNQARAMRSSLLSVIHGQDKKDILIRQWGNVDAHIHSSSGKLGEILSEGQLSESIETLILSGILGNGDFDVLKTIAKLRVLNLTKIELADGQTELPPFALKELPNVEEVIMPSGVKKISKGLFMDSPSLSNLTIPEGVSVIEDMAFSGCKGLSTVKLPKTITSIETAAFAGCLLHEIILEGELPPSLGSEVFGEEVFESCTISVPKGSLGAYRENESWAKFAKFVERD